jgi:membrane protease YdiL (CAAX protease family)
LDPYFEHSGVAIGLAILGTVVMAPVVEETLFRGFFFTGFRSHIGPLGAAVLSSVLFSLPHAFPVFFPFSLNLNPTQALSMFLAGLIWAGMRHESDSVFPSMLAHAAWNFMVGF